MAKRLTEHQKKEIIQLFISGKSLDQISNQFNCTKLTISRNLKNNIDSVTYKELLAVSKSNKKLIKNKKQKIKHSNHNESEIDIKSNKDYLNKNFTSDIDEDYLSMSEFIEIKPLTLDIENSPQKDFTSIPLSDVTFPKTVFMIVDKNVELEIKSLKDYPKWQFLSEDELKRKSIEIYSELKIAKSFCSKEQKVIKVPNPNVFSIVANRLLSKGISRIVSSDKLIAL